MLEAGPLPYFRYVGSERELVHNANLLACAVLARTARVLGEERLLEPVRAAVATSVDAQRRSESWSGTASAACVSGGRSTRPLAHIALTRAQGRLLFAVAVISPGSELCASHSRTTSSVPAILRTTSTHEA